MGEKENVGMGKKLKSQRFWVNGGGKVRGEKGTETESTPPQGLKKKTDGRRSELAQDQKEIFFLSYKCTFLRVKIYTKR